MSNGTTELTKRFRDGRVITVTFEDAREVEDKVLSEKRNQDDKYQRAFSRDTRAITEAFRDLCDALEWD